VSASQAVIRLSSAHLLPNWPACTQSAEKIETVLDELKVGCHPKCRAREDIP